MFIKPCTKSCIFSEQGVRYLSSKMEFVKVLLSKILMVVVTILLLQCIHFLTNLIALWSSTSARTLNAFLKILLGALFQNQWLKFLIMVSMEELRMVCPMSKRVSYLSFTMLTNTQNTHCLTQIFTVICWFTDLGCDVTVKPCKGFFLKIEKHWIYLFNWQLQLLSLRLNPSLLF